MNCRQCGSFWYWINNQCRRCGYNEDDMKKEFVRNPYNYDSDELSDQTGLACPEATLTQQQFLQESDINYIAERFMKTGEVKQVVHMPMSGDFQGIFDFQSAMNTVVQAKQEFMTLPAKVRSRFDNDPAKLIAFLEDKENKDEAMALGLIPRPRIDPPQAPAPGPATPPSVEPAAPTQEKPSKPVG